MKSPSLARPPFSVRSQSARKPSVGLFARPAKRKTDNPTDTGWGTAIGSTLSTLSDLYIAISKDKMAGRLLSGRTNAADQGADPNSCIVPPPFSTESPDVPSRSFKIRQQRPAWCLRALDDLLHRQQRARPRFRDVQAPCQIRRFRRRRHRLPRLDGRSRPADAL